MKKYLLDRYGSMKAKSMDKHPIFIIGCPRSGTTLVRVILDSHPNICCGPETHLIKNLKTLKESIDKSWHILKTYGIQQKVLVEKLSEIFQMFPEHYVETKDKQRWAEKTPDNIFYVDFINELFPSCKFINVIRDGRDVVCSFKERWGRKTIFYAIKTWNRSIDLTYQYRTRFTKDRYLEIRYEQLVSNAEEETKKIMEFLGEPWTSELLEHHKKQHDFWFKLNQDQTDHLKKERKPLRHSPSKPIFSSSAGKWKKNLNILEKALANLLLSRNLTRLGYR